MNKALNFQPEMELKGTICKKWPPVKFMLQTNKGQHFIRVTRDSSFS